MNTAHVWRAALERLRRELSRAQFDTWLRGTQLEGVDDGVCELRVRTTFAKDMLETRYRDRIEAAIAEVAGAPCALRIAVIASDGGENDADDASPTRSGGSRRAHAPTDTGGYDRPALFAETDESSPSAQASPAVPRNPGASAPRHALPPAASASRSERIRAALDRGRASGSGANGPRVRADGDHQRAPASGRQDGSWTDGTAAIDARKARDGRSTTALPTINVAKV